jgi:oxygen-independent coproporphyrinogen-3 oxidase
MIFPLDGLWGHRAFHAPEALYLHIPLCSSRCGYCDFHSCSRTAFARTGMDEESYVTALLESAKDFRDSDPATVKTVYVGGGTPTALSLPAFSRLIASISSLFSKGCREWTVEANPESLDPEKIRIMRGEGVGRISLGLQRMDDEGLALLGRAARLKDNLKALDALAGAGFELSGDFISGIPRTPGTVPDPSKVPVRDGAMKLHRAVEFLADRGFAHISLYDLVVEESTPLARQLASGELSAADEDETLEERAEAEAALLRKGFYRYEVSNYALPGHESLHNGAYWSMHSYAGLGSGAVSTLIVKDQDAARELSSDAGFSLRLEQSRDLGLWKACARSGVEGSWIDRRDSAFEMIMMGLRTAKGVDCNGFEARFGLELPSLLGKTMEKWKERFSLSEGFLSLDARGLDILNGILLDAMDDMDSRFAKER